MYITEFTFSSVHFLLCLTLLPVFTKRLVFRESNCSVPC